MRQVSPGDDASEAAGSVLPAREPPAEIFSAEPLLAKSAHGVRYCPWPGMTGFVSPPMCGQIQSRWCQPWVSAWQLAWKIPLPPGSVMAQESDGLMQWPLPALGATGLVAGHFDVAAAGGCRCLTFAWPPGDEDRAWFPLMPKAALLREARPHLPSRLPHTVYSNTRSNHQPGQLLDAN